MIVQKRAVLAMLHKGWIAFCMAGVLVGIGARTLHYAVIGPAWFDSLLSQIIHLQVLMIIVGFGLLIPTAAIAVVLLVLMVVKRNWCFDRLADQLRTRQWVYALMWGGLFFYNMTIDLDRDTIRVFAPMLLGAFPLLLYRGSSVVRQRVLHGVLAAGLLVIWALAPSVVSSIGLLFWCAWLALLRVLVMRGMARRDVLPVALASLVAFQIGMAHSVRPKDAGAVLLGDKGYPYTFCEIPALNKLYAAVPCDSGGGCDEGFIAEHDTRDLTNIVERHVLDKHLQGRLVHLVCLEDRVQVGMAKSTVEGQFHQENVLEFQATEPTMVRRSLFGGDVGPRLVWDRRHDAVYYSSEFSQRIFRADRGSGVLNRNVADAIYGVNTDSEAFGSHLVENDGLHEGRDSLFIAQWLSGSKIFEVSRSDGKLLATYDPHNGGNHGYAVDEQRGHLWAAGVWGLDVLDIPGGRRLAGTWLGPGVRLPVIDRQHDLVYVPNIVGRLWVFDRNSFALLGSVHVGGGSRNPYLSADGTKLFVGFTKGYAYWETAEIARRFRSRAGSNG